MTVSVKTVSYQVSAIPYEDDDAHAFQIKVEYRGGGRWAVTRGGQCWNRVNQTFDYESLPSGRTEEFFAECRYATAEEAIDDAKTIVPLLTVNGWTVQQAIRMHNGEELCGGLVERGVRCSLTPDHGGEHKP